MFAVADVPPVRPQVARANVQGVHTRAGDEIAIRTRQLATMGSTRQRSGCNDWPVSDNVPKRSLRMRHATTVVPYVLVMVAVVVAMDLLFFRTRAWTWERLAANVGIVLVFGAFYFRFSGG